MKRIFTLLLLFNVFIVSQSLWAQVHHRFSVSLAPALHSLTVVDQIEFSEASTAASGTARTSAAFRLHKNLHVTLPAEEGRLVLLPTPPSQEFQNYQILLNPKHRGPFTLKYTGVLYDPVVNDASRGLISEQGATLLGAMDWLPNFSENMTYEVISTTLPSGWLLASPQKQRMPQQEVYFIAGPFFSFTQQVNSAGVMVKVFLRKNEPALASPFLTLLPGYIKDFSAKYGPYPYQDFTVIENFWETGFGMPAFTLLGPQVMRLPQILNSSLPHELLHNWWGNGVFVDETGGNWSEGLTTYLADYAQQDLQPGQGRLYRLQTLMNYQDFTRNGSDFPLRKFTSREGFASQAVGYGKAMMFFHMLSTKLGPGIFQQSMAHFFKTYCFKEASYNDILKSVQLVSHKNLGGYFTRLLDYVGAPSLKLVSAQSSQAPGGGANVTVLLRQISDQPYPLTVPVRFTFADRPAFTQRIEFSAAEKAFAFHLPLSPTALEVDPDFDVFRWLDSAERPLALSAVFGAKKIAVASALPAQNAGLIAAWKDRLPPGALQPVDNDSLDHLPPGTEAVVMIGDSELFAGRMTTLLAKNSFGVAANSVSLFGISYAKEKFSTVVMARATSGTLLVWVRGPGPTSALASRLLHYGRYGVLALDAQAAPLKATWPVTDSPLRVEF